MGKKVLMFVRNNCTRDARVLKEAKTLADKDYSVEIVAVMDNNCKIPFENKGDFTITRLEVVSLVVKILIFLREKVFVKGHFNIISILNDLFPRKKKVRTKLKVENETTKRSKQSLLLFFYALFLKIFFPVSLNYLAKLKVNKLTKCLYTISLVVAFVFFTLFNLFVYLVRKILFPLKVLRRKYKHKNNSEKNKIPFGLRQIKKELTVFKRNLVKFYKKIRKSILKLISSLRKHTYLFIKKVLLPFHKPLASLDFYIKGIKYSLKVRPETYHCHDLNTLWIGVIAAKLTKSKLVYDSHELYTEISTFNKRQRFILGLTEKILIKFPDEIITVNESIANELVKRYNIKHPKIVMNCPPKINLDTKPIEKIDDTWEKIRESCPRDTTFILYQGGFAPNRGLENLIRSMKFTSGCVLVMLGWGRLEDDLRLLVDKESLKEKVIFVPPVSQEELLYFTKHADFGVIPYQNVGLNNYYATPNKLFEYAMSGLPILASNFPELSRIIYEYKIGETFNPNDSEDIAKAINKAVEDRIKIKEYQHNTVVAANRFNWQQEEKVLQKIYFNLLNAS